MKDKDKDNDATTATGLTNVVRLSRVNGKLNLLNELVGEFANSTKKTYTDLEILEILDAKTEELT